MLGQCLGSGVTQARQSVEGKVSKVSPLMLGQCLGSGVTQARQSVEEKVSLLIGKLSCQRQVPGRIHQARQSVEGKVSPMMLA